MSFLAMLLGIAFSWLNFRSMTSAYSLHCGVARRIRTSSPRGVRPISRFVAKEGHPMTLDFAEWDRARLARDPSYDGRFFTGVRTTGVYCRPRDRGRRHRQFL